MAEALRPKLVALLSSMMATVEQSTGAISGRIVHSSAGRIADAVMTVTRQHDEDYARTTDLGAVFRRLPVEIRIGDTFATTAEGTLTDESAAMLGAAAERDFAGRQRDGGQPWAGDRAAADPELAAMAAIVTVMDRLDNEAILLGEDVHERVIRWAMARWRVSG